MYSQRSLASRLHLPNYALKETMRYYLVLLVMVRGTCCVLAAPGAAGLSALIVRDVLRFVAQRAADAAILLIGRPPRRSRFLGSRPRAWQVRSMRESQMCLKAFASKECPFLIRSIPIRPRRGKPFPAQIA